MLFAAKRSFRLGCSPFFLVPDYLLWTSHPKAGSVLLILQLGNSENIYRGIYLCIPEGICSRFYMWGKSSGRLRRARPSGAQDVGGAEAARAQAGTLLWQEKTDLQALWTASMVNAKRLFTLSAEDEELAEGLREALLAACRRPSVWNERRVGRKSTPRLRLNQRLPRASASLPSVEG
jgi:hypothetical protein